MARRRPRPPRRLPIATTTAAGPLAGQTTTQGARLLTEVQRRFLVENTPITRSHKKSPTKPSTHPTRPVVAGGGVRVGVRRGRWVPAARRGEQGREPSLTAILPPLADGSLAVEAKGHARAGHAARVRAERHPVGARTFAVYPDVAPGVHAFRRTTGDGVDFYEVFTASELLAFRYDVTLAGVAGLRVIDGSVELLDAGGAPRLPAYPRPITCDSAGVARVGTADVGAPRSMATRAARGVARSCPPGGATCTLVVRFDARGLRCPSSSIRPGSPPRPPPSGTTDHQLLALPAGSDAGKILLVGGTGTVPTVTELYNPATDTWAAAGSLPIGLGAGMNAAVLPNGQVVAGGGMRSPSTVLVRSTTGAWSAGAAMNARASSRWPPPESTARTWCSSPVASRPAPSPARPSPSPARSTTTPSPTAGRRFPR